MLTDFVKVATTDDLGNGEMMVVNADDEEILLSRVDNTYYATQAICTHAYGMLDLGDLYGHEIECPFHGGRFDVRTGEATHEPAEEPLKTYAVKFEGSDVLVGPGPGSQ